MGQKSPVEVQHAQKSMELLGGLGRVTVLEMDHSFIERLATLGGHLLTETHFARFMRFPYL
jgi:hypothetical protein